METFAKIGNEFINFYSKDNPILNMNDTCYFLAHNVNDYHLPLICKGTIVFEKFNDGMNKTYYIKLLSIQETPKTINEFVIGKPFLLRTYLKDNIGSKKLVQITTDLNFDKYLFKVEAFFVREKEEKIIELRDEYIRVIRKDIIKQLSDIDSH